MESMLSLLHHVKVVRRLPTPSRTLVLETIALTPSQGQTSQRLVMQVSLMILHMLLVCEQPGYMAHHCPSLSKQGQIQLRKHQNNEALKCETLGAVCQKTVQQPKALHRMIASSDYSHK